MLQQLLTAKSFPSILLTLAGLLTSKTIESPTHLSPAVHHHVVHETLQQLLLHSSPGCQAGSSMSGAPLLRACTVHLHANCCCGWCWWCCGRAGAGKERKLVCKHVCVR
eukprot:1158084-Pelagomonas_calceolata.AAC.18